MELLSLFGHNRLAILSLQQSFEGLFLPKTCRLTELHNHGFPPDAILLVGRRLSASLLRSCLRRVDATHEN